MSDIKSILEQARELWRTHRTVGHYAINAEGVPVTPYSEDACGWCALGAVEKCAVDFGFIPAQAMSISHILYDATQGKQSVIYTSDRNPNEMEIIWDEAIQLAEGGWQFLQGSVVR